MKTCWRHGGPMPGRVSTALARRLAVLEAFAGHLTDPAPPSLHVAPWGPLPRDRPELEQLLNVLVLRRTGLSSSVLGWLTEWQPERLLNLLCKRAMRGWTQLPLPHCAAHRNAFSKAAVAKDKAAIHTQLSAAIIDPIGALWKKRELVMQLVNGPTWFPILVLIAGTYGHGYFWASVIAFDLRTQRIATAFPRDRMTFCGFGPGGLRGLNRVLRRPPYAPIEPAVALAWAHYLSAAVRWPIPKPEAYLVQWFLCEYSQAPAALDFAG